MTPKIIILPGNGNSHIDTDNWYAWVRDQLSNQGFTVIARDMPDPEIARMYIWLPFIKNELQADQNTIIIGHSSGGVAALRYLETNPLFGAVVAGVNYTDLGYPEEKAAGYYDAPWQWGRIKKNSPWLVQFASQNDPFIPIHEARFIHQQLNTEYYEFTSRGHFQAKTFPEIVSTINQKTKALPH